MGGRRVGAPAQQALWRGEDDTRPVSECALTDLDCHPYHLGVPFFRFSSPATGAHNHAWSRKLLRLAASRPSISAV